jgi:hypothetical protein
MPSSTKTEGYVMKKIAILLAVMLGMSVIPSQASQASEVSKPTIVIIDTAFDTTVPELQGKVIQEVCIIEGTSCPNKTGFQEGLGSASLPSSVALSGGFEHGTYMATVATTVNPNANLILIRISGINKSNRMLSASPNAITMALNWVRNNTTKYNIVATSTSLSNTVFNRTGNYCRIGADLQNAIVALQSLNVAAVFSAGNTRDILRVSYPACIPQAIAVGATNYTETHGSLIINPISLASAGGPDLDFYSLGSWQLRLTRMNGQTSPATAAFAAYWSKQVSKLGTTNYTTVYDSIKKSTKPASNQFVSSNLFVDVLG